MAPKRARTGTNGDETDTNSNRLSVNSFHQLRFGVHAFQSPPVSPQSYTFAGEKKGRPLNLANLVRREMLPALKEGNCEWHGWHGFRRGLATRLHESKVQVETIQAILRHSDPKVTQDSYIVIKSDRTSKAMQRVDDGEILKAWRKTRSQNSR